jgi:hypothetical protein
VADEKELKRLYRKCENHFHETMGFSPAFRSSAIMLGHKAGLIDKEQALGLLKWLSDQTYGGKK